MKKERIMRLLFSNFMKWYKINYWQKIKYDKKVEPTEDEVKIYLGYHGVNRR